MKKGFRLQKIKGGVALITRRYKKRSQVIKRRDNILPIIAKELDKQISSATVDISHIEYNPNLVITTQKGGDVYSKSMIKK